MLMGVTCVDSLAKIPVQNAEKDSAIDANLGGFQRLKLLDAFRSAKMLFAQKSKSAMINLSIFHRIHAISAIISARVIVQIVHMEYAATVKQGLNQ